MPPPNEFILLAVDTAGIQDYIFNSNRLRENIGASYLVASVTGTWAFEAVQKAAGNGKDVHNVINNDGTLDDQVTIDQPSTVAEVLYSGGGNFVVLFRDSQTARIFTQTLSRRALKEASGLRLMIHAIPFIWGSDVLMDKLSQLLEGMKRKRSTQSNVMPLAGLGVTVMCSSTALPAVKFKLDHQTDNERERPVSAEVVSKIDAADHANAALQKAFPREDGYTYPLDLDHLGRTRGESSLIAVVHADGDGIGKQIEAIGDSFTSATQARDHINTLRQFSRDLAAAAKAALAGTLDYLKQLAIDSKEVAGLFTDCYIPFRPLVFGGDDVTFVSDGRIGLALTLEYLRQFQAETKKRFDQPLTACAGVAIVKSHYPFARAYELAEELSKSAKKYRRDSKREECYLDWHFTAGGLYGGLDEIRKREYTVSAGSMTLRPVAASGNGIRSWRTIQSGLTAFQSEGWKEKRNKAKALREKLRGGPDAVGEFTQLYQQNLPDIDSFTNGWADAYCGYFDAIELMDLYLPLLEKKNR